MGSQRYKETRCPPHDHDHGYFWAVTFYMLIGLKNTNVVQR